MDFKMFNPAKLPDIERGGNLTKFVGRSSWAADDWLDNGTTLHFLACALSSVPCPNLNDFQVLGTMSEFGVTCLNLELVKDRYNT
jgi:hypothetical protein